MFSSTSLSTKVCELEISEIERLAEKLRTFAKERDWEQFHSPKNISMALAAEAGELLELFQWLTQSQSKNLNKEDKEEVIDELADIFIYLIRMADELDVKLIDVAEKKVKKNAVKYPVDKSKGRSTKYTKL